MNAPIQIVKQETLHSTIEVQRVEQWNCELQAPLGNGVDVLVLVRGANVLTVAQVEFLNNLLVPLATAHEAYKVNLEIPDN